MFKTNGAASLQKNHQPSEQPQCSERVWEGFSYSVVKVCTKLNKDISLIFPIEVKMGGGTVPQPGSSVCKMSFLREVKLLRLLTEVWNPWCTSIKSDFLLHTLRGGNSALTRACHSKLVPASTRGFNISQVPGKKICFNPYFLPSTILGKLRYWTFFSYSSHTIQALSLLFTITFLTEGVS